MTKTESMLCKGVAICIMLFFHLFSMRDSHIYDDTVWNMIARANNPVPFYLVLSGYGLGKVYETKGFDGSRYKRTIKLLLRYWLILIPFILLSVLFHNPRVILDPLHIFCNLTTWRTSYYPEGWFILPYIMLTLSADIIFRGLDKVNVWLGLVICYGVYMVAAYMNRYQFFQANVFQYFYLLFPFVLGRTMAQQRWVEAVKTRLDRKPIYVPYLLLGVVVVIRLYFYTGALIAVYAAVVIMLIVSMRRPAWSDKMLVLLGKHSTNMWLIHTWFCYYLFRNFIYGFVYPPVIFLVLVAVSLACSYVMDLWINPVIRFAVREKK